MRVIVKCEGCAKRISDKEVSDEGAKSVILAAVERARLVGAENWSVLPDRIIQWSICDECYAVETSTEVAIY